MLKVINVVGARPNYMKVAPIVAAMQRRATEFASFLVHTGQHYDQTLSDIFFRDLDLPAPDAHLGVGSGTHAQQIANVMQRFEPIVADVRPDWVVVVGDVNSTLACALVAAKMNVKVAHVEAGLRSRDRTMPEEINRLLTDQVSDLLLTPSADADLNLRAEGIPTERICLVGNVMIDSLRTQLELAARSNVRARLSVSEGDYALVTLHRPSNVDDAATLARILAALRHLSRRLPVLFPVHPRTRRRLAELDAIAEDVDVRESGAEDLRFIEPLGYLDFLHLCRGARLVLTDSGGIQEETTALGIPCLTLRENTERPITIEIGTNQLVGTNARKIIEAGERVLDGKHSAIGAHAAPPLWDGRTADRILDALSAHYAHTR